MTTITERTKEALANGKIVGDGHTIFDPVFYAPYFSEDELRQAGLIEEYHSDYSSGKSTIFDPDTGEAVESVKGVYNLTFLYWLASQNNVVDYRECFGRGSQARAIVEALKGALL